jgi:hypothetical protein
VTHECNVLTFVYFNTWDEQSETDVFDHSLLYDIFQTIDD